ncbi:MAG: hypothetical protein WCI73_08510, partial [Phycisphaerae bacterium]
FGLLEEHEDGVIVLDDVSSIFQQPVALQLLLAALGRQGDGKRERIVKYKRQGHEETVRFTGGIICISNLELHDTPLMEALKSRVHYLRYEPTNEQMAALMMSVASKGWPTKRPVMTPVECLKVATFLITESKRLGMGLDMRLLVDKAFPDYLQHRAKHTESHWKDLVITTLEQRMVEPQHPTTPRRSRADKKADDQEVAKAVFAEFATPDERVKAWIERTGKSKRAFYRRLEEIGVTE